MTTSSPTSLDVAAPFSEQEQAEALWTYVRVRWPQFTSAQAREVIRRTAPRAEETPKTLAKRVRKELAFQGVIVKHAATLEAAARILGYGTWHDANRGRVNATLKLTSMSPGAGQELISGWRDLAPRLCEACTDWLRQRPVRVFQVRFGAAYMMITAPEPKEGSGPFNTETWPLLTVNPVANDAAWLDDAPAALETLRRHLEESGRAVLDGVAVLQLCAARKPVRIDEVCNAELILLRADNELDPGYEIARGDEMTCWSQFELAIKDHTGAEVTFDAGAWRIGSGRYVWQMSTLHPKQVVPGLTIRELNEENSAKLLRRYRIAKRLHGQKLIYHEQTKRIEYLGNLAETYRVDLEKLMLALGKAGLTWESYCAEVGEERPMVPELPVGFVLALLERLKVEDPNAMFARPTRSQLKRVDDDGLLRALMPRVDHVRYRLARGASDEVKSAVRDAVEDFASSLRVQKLQAGGALADAKDPLPYLVYANDAEELRLKLAEQGLVMYAGVMPHLMSTKGVSEQLPNSWPFAIGNSLFLDIDFGDRDTQGADSEALRGDYRNPDSAAIKSSGEAPYASPGGQRAHVHEVKGMVEPLRKRRKNGKAYQRRTAVEQELQELDKLTLPDIVVRARAGEQKAGPAMPSEALVHILRREVRVARPDGRTQGPIDALSSILMARCAVILRRRLHGYDELAREQISEEVMNRLVDDIYEDGDKADYAEINFNHWLARNRLDAIRKHARTAARLDQLGEAVENLEDGEAQLVPEDGEPEAGHDNTPEKLYSLKEARERANLPSIIEQADFSPDQLHRIADMVMHAKLPADVLYAFFAHYLGRKVSSQDPKEHTLVKHFGKSEKTIRNWIARAEKVFAELRKKGKT